MKVSFIGSPCSGKTTTAVMTFSRLKDNGIPCEFITEQARLYIAKTRWLTKPSKIITLNDHDQYKIMYQQFEIENIMHYSVGEDVVLITDSSPINALFYMTEQERNNERTQEILCKFNDLIGIQDLFFHTAPVRPSSLFDPNRVHSYEESVEINGTIPAIINKYIPVLESKLMYLTGDSQFRFNEVVKQILTKLVS